MADEQPEPITTSKGPGLRTLIKAVAFVSVIVLLQITAASMIIPSADETAKIAEELATTDSQKTEETGSEESPADKEIALLAAGEMVEVSLGAYHVLSTNLATGSRTNVSFELFATVMKNEENDFLDLFQASEQRIREQITVTVRGSDMTDLTDPTLGLIKRRILEKTNRALGKPLLREAIFSSFSFEER